MKQEKLQGSTAPKPLDDTSYDSDFDTGNEEYMIFGRKIKSEEGKSMRGIRKDELMGLSLRFLLLCFLLASGGSGCFKPVVAEKPHLGQTWTCDKEADDAMQRHDYRLGILLHERLLEKEPQNALALYHLGYAHSQLGDHLKEVSYYEKAVELGFEQEGIFFNLGMAYAELDQMDKATGAFKRALDFNAHNPDTHFQLGLVYFRSALDEEAEQEFLETLKIDPNYTEARLYLSNLYSDRGDLEKAQDELRKVLEQDPTDVRAKEMLERLESR